jgi:hypothetical protein
VRDDVQAIKFGFVFTEIKRAYSTRADHWRAMPQQNGFVLAK